MLSLESIEALFDWDIWADPEKKQANGITIWRLGGKVRLVEVLRTSPGSRNFAGDVWNLEG